MLLHDIGALNSGYFLFLYSVLSIFYTLHSFLYRLSGILSLPLQDNEDGRYEKGEREPSFQTVSFIALTFGTSTDYLYGMTNDPNAKSVTVEYDQNPELFDLIQAYLSDDNKAQRLLTYFKKLT